MSYTTFCYSSTVSSTTCLIRIVCEQYQYAPSHVQVKCYIFTALHGMQRGLNDEISVCLSVCPSVCPSDVWIVIKRKKNQSRFLYHAKEHSL